MQTILSTDLFMEILSSLNPVNGMNNYEPNCCEVWVGEGDIIFAESLCLNEYGGRYSNNDKQPLDLTEWDYQLLGFLIDELRTHGHLEVGEDFPIEED